MQHRLIGGATQGNGLFMAIKEPKSSQSAIPVKRKEPISGYIVETEKKIEQSLLEVMKDQYSTLTKELNEQIKECADAHTALEPLRAERDDALNSLSESQADNDFLKTLNLRLQERTRILEPEVIFLKSELENFRRNTSEIQQKLNVAERCITKKDDEILKLRSEMNTLNDSLNCIHQEIETSKKSLEDIESEQREKDEIEATIVTLSEANEILERKLKEAEEMLSAQKEQTQILHTKMKKSEESRSRTVEKLLRRDREVEELKLRLDAKDAELKNSEEKKHLIKLKLRGLNHQLSKVESTSGFSSIAAADEDSMSTLATDYPQSNRVHGTGVPLTSRSGYGTTVGVESFSPNTSGSAIGQARPTISANSTQQLHSTSIKPKIAETKKVAKKKTSLDSLLGPILEGDEDEEETWIEDSVEGGELNQEGKSANDELSTLLDNFKIDKSKLSYRKHQYNENSDDSDTEDALYFQQHPISSKNTKIPSMSDEPGGATAQLESSSFSEGFELGEDESEKEKKKINVNKPRSRVISPVTQTPISSSSATSFLHSQSYLKKSRVDQKNNSSVPSRAVAKKSGAILMNVNRKNSMGSSNSSSSDYGDGNSSSRTSVSKARPGLVLPLISS